MKAAVIHGPGDLRIEEVPEPTAGPGEVVLEVTGAGVCGSDAWMYRAGREGLPEREQGPPPFVPGHEFAGVVVECGPGTTLPEGELVADGAGVSCGACARCREGRTNLCESYRTLGAYHRGGLAQYVVVPEATCVPVAPHGVRGDDAALAQPMAIAHHGVARGRVAAGDRLLLTGAGGVGAFVVWAASRRGAHVTVVDVDPERLALAERLGAAATIVTTPDADLGEQLAGHGPWTVAVETTGADGPLQSVFRALERGSRLVLLGMHHEPRALDLAWATYGELDVLGTQAHVCAVDLPAALDLLGQREEGWADVAPVVLPLDELVEEALEPLSQGRSRRIKSIFDPSAHARRPYSRDLPGAVTASARRA
jgi:(R,R)-butanediol dehydrogenase / meso-butanediol dehydrogenase / diacetyl reductase